MIKDDNSKKEFSKELEKNLRKKKVRKYALMALALVVVVSSIVGLNIEDKDSLLPDGQGNIVTNQIEEEDTVADEVQKDATVETDDVKTDGAEDDIKD
ncbi:MAG: hypothetical protein IKT62_05220, partial [Firmicutes bacterium]|nr:hypothetical protein [Bacillota bacterium]